MFKMINFDISSDFFVGKNMCQHRPKTSPYTKSERKVRREEVFKLHFEYGYSARKIAQTMKIHRNTINRDISFWYSRLQIESDKRTFDDMVNRQFFRMDSQRTRLLQELNLEKNLQEKLQIEKMILDLDSKITNFIIKIETSQQSVFDQSVGVLNSWMKENNHQERYMSLSGLYKIPQRTREKIMEILKETQH